MTIEEEKEVRHLIDVIEYKIAEVKNDFNQGKIRNLSEKSRFVKVPAEMLYNLLEKIDSSN
tara:strand:+ start:420 stop:602 length:183 start_codon:yes stop_codon:yes gene_type:complete